MAERKSTRNRKEPSRETVTLVLGWSFIGLGILGIIVQAVLFIANDLGYTVVILDSSFIGLTIGIGALGLGCIALFLAFRAERQSDRIMMNTESTYYMTVGAMKYNTVYPEPFDVDTEPKPILSLDAIGGPITNIRVSLFYPELELDDVLTVVFKMQEPVQRNSEPIVWSTKTEIIKGPKEEREFSTFEIGDCYTQFEMWVKKNREEREIIVRAIMSYIS